MKRVLPIFIVVVTAVLLVTAWFQSGGAQRREMRSANSPEQAVRLMLSQIQSHNYDAAYDRLANRTDIDKTSFMREFQGSYGSLLTYASLEKFEVSPLHSTDSDANVRAHLHYSTAVGPLDDNRDMKVQKSGDIWKVVWPVSQSAKLPPQVIPVNYLRWDVISRGASDDWGVQNVDLVGEVVNEDSVPAYVNVGATLLDAGGKELAQESSFDKISHVLLPKQVTPYRIDFPSMRLEKIKNVRMDAKALLVAASADPVIEINQQKMETDPLGKKVLRGDLLNQSGQIVNIPHVIAAYYDSNGKVIWVSDGYVAQALLPQIPVSFAVDVPPDIAKNVQTYRVVVNHYDTNSQS